MNYEDTCQREDQRLFSRLSRPKMLVVAGYALEYLKTKGVRATAEKAALFFRLRLAERNGHSKIAPAQTQPEETLGLEPGELVEVKSREEISATLDRDRRVRGLCFLPEMSGFCGRRFRVHKRVERILLEESKQVRKLRNTVLLEGVMCDGGTIGCGKSCFYFWRECWLKRVNSP